jgi:hypothetical protein
MQSVAWQTKKKMRQHHLGRQTKARQESRQFPAGAVFILRHGRRPVLFASSFADGLGRYHRCRWIPRAPSTWRQRTGVGYPFNLRYKHCYAVIRDDLQVSTRREALMARRAARRGTYDRVIFGRQIRAWTLPGQRRAGSAYGAAGSLITMLI